MFVLTSKGLMLFETNFNITEGLRIMSPKQVYQTEPVLMMGVVTTPRGKLEDTEIWCCSNEGGTFKIFNGYDYRMHGVKQFTIPEVDKSIQQVCVSVCLSVFVSVHLSVSVSIYASVCVCVCVCMCVCVWCVSHT